MNKREYRHTKKYYEFEQFILSKCFQNWLADLKEMYAGFGIPLPEESIHIIKAADWHKWSIVVCDRRREIEETEEYKARKFAINNGRPKYTSDEYTQLMNLEEECLPPLLGYPVRELLEECAGIKREDKDYKLYYDFIIEHVLHGREHYFDSPFSTSLRRNEKTEEMEYWIRIHGHTRKEDIMNNWDLIAARQKYLPDYQANIKKRPNVARDVRICELHTELSSKQDKLQCRTPGKASIFTKIALALDDENYSDIDERTIKMVLNRNAK